MDVHLKSRSVTAVTARPALFKSDGELAASSSYLFQWVFEFRYKDGNMMGRIFAALSLIKLMMYSLFQ